MVSLFEARTVQDVIYAVERGDDINEVQFRRPEAIGNASTPLWIACIHGRTEIVQVLLEHGAKPHDEVGSSSLILSATIFGYRDIIYQLLKAGVNINTGIGTAGGTPLINAAKCGHIDCLDLLLEQGADVDAQDEYGRTALMYACKERNIDAVDRLLQYGAKI